MPTMSFCLCFWCRYMCEHRTFSAKCSVRIPTYIACYNVCKAFSIMLWLCGTKFNEAQVASLYKLLHQPCISHSAWLWGKCGASKTPDIICIIYLVRTYKFSVRTHWITLYGVQINTNIHTLCTLVWLLASICAMIDIDISCLVWIVWLMVWWSHRIVFTYLYEGYSMAITISVSLK